MARALIFDGPEQKWVQFDEDTEVLINFIDKAKLGGMMKKAGKRARLAGGDADMILNQITGEEAVGGWRNINDHAHPGFVDQQGNPLSFDAKTRDLFMRKWREFSNFVNETAVDSKLFAEEEADASKIREDVKNE